VAAGATSTARAHTANTVRPAYASLVEGVNPPKNA
jgi:hypothetical protein